MHDAHSPEPEPEGWSEIASFDAARQTAVSTEPNAGHSADGARSDGRDPVAFDHHMMGIALAMGRRGLGRTAPNPSVGAVVVDPRSSEVVARAVTAPGGRPHAEPLAIAAAGERARGATLYVTLEPCAHHGRTAPCADAVIDSGIAGVVVGIEDPDPRVAGRGLAKLRAAGIAVTRGVRAAEARELTRGHILRIAERRPLVTLKLALAADGSVPRGDGRRPTFVTSPEARAAGHLLRAEADAILVGSGTIAADDPELTCRLPGLGDRSPMRIVLATRGIDLVGSRLAATADAGPVVVFAGDRRMDAGGRRAASHDVVPDHRWFATEAMPLVGGRLWLPAVLERLAEMGVTRLLVEGGPTIWRAFAEAGLADEVVVFHAGAANGAHVSADGLLQGQLWPGRWRVVDSRPIGPDRMIKFVVERS